MSTATPGATPVAAPPTFDVVIVGSGASGCLMAAKLAQAGKKVVMLEAGPPVTTDDMWSSLDLGAPDPRYAPAAAHQRG